jgi:hypothetical protein
LTAQLAGLASRHPVLMIFEDVHWIDPTSLEALNRIMDRIRTLPALLIVTFRPEFSAPWIGQSHVASMTLSRLGEREATAIVANLAGNKVLPTDVMAEIVERTDGIPLFVEEMTKAMLEAESEGEARSAAAAVPSPAHAVPASLHASLMARLDRLGPAKDVARTAATIGREFSYELLVAVADLTEKELTSSLENLTNSGLLFQRGAPPHATYFFKHALVRDAAYGMLLREFRKQLHARIGTKLEEVFSDAAERQPDLLAYHFEEGGSSEKAIEYWLKAGKQSINRASMIEGLSQLNKASALLAIMPDGTWRHQHELTLQIAVASALLVTLGPAAPAVREAYERARYIWEILDRPSDFEPRIPLLWHHWVRGELEESHKMASELKLFANTRNDRALRFFGSSFLAATCLERAEFAECRTHSEQCLVLFDPVLCSRRAMYNGRIFALAILSRTLFYLGYTDQARLKKNQALSEARQLSNPLTLSVTLISVLGLEWEIESTQTVLSTLRSLSHLNFSRPLTGNIFVTGACRNWGRCRRAQPHSPRPYLSFAPRGCCNLCHFI